jgi:hypothetical protein
MLNKTVTTLLIIACLFSIQCSSKVKNTYNNKILGVWERVGDDRSGIIIKVIQLSGEDSYIGKIVSKSKSAREFEIGDIVWQNVQGVNPTQWTGIVLLKRETLLSGAVGQTYEAKFLLINDNLIEVYIDNKTQKWIRSKS